ncbi:MAG: 1-acyl-sn-glycerol-3-phosphate acyltransferase [Paracoccaceae bacterium]
MSRIVEVPLWLLSLILFLAALSFLSHFLFPSVRWFLRRRVERLVGELNKRLERPIQPFKLMHRNDMIVRLAHDPKVMEGVVAAATAGGEPESVAFERARAYAREIVPSFSALIYFGIAARLARRVVRLLYYVRIERFDAEALAAVDRKATVVFVMNHRSNMDYVLVTYLAASRSALSYAVGEWARVWPLSGLIRSMGAYFIRRRSDNALYRRVLARYVQMATEEGVTQAIFPEGGLSLDGRLAAPKLGILSYIVAGWQEGGREVVFVPVALNYDRVFEDRVLIAAAAAGRRRFRADPFGILRFVLRHAWRRLTGRYRRFGYAAVSFGVPLTLSEVMAGGAGDATERLARQLMQRIRGVMPVLPVPLVALAFGDATEIGEAALLDRAAALCARLSAAGATVAIPKGPVADRVAAGLGVLTRRRLVVKEGTAYRVAPGAAPVLRFYADSIAQLLPDDPAEIRESGAEGETERS